MKISGASPNVISGASMQRRSTPQSKPSGGGMGASASSSLSSSLKSLKSIMSDKITGTRINTIV